MRTLSREDGFTLMEMLITTAITLVVLGMAMTTFKNALDVNQTATQTADASQNLRAGTNLLVRDLMQAGREVPSGGIAIPSGGGVGEINLPAPPDVVINWDNTVNTQIPAIIPGPSKGPTIDGQSTDVITMLMSDAIPRGDSLTTTAPTAWIDGTDAGGNLVDDLAVTNTTGTLPTIKTDGSSFNVGNNTAWIAGDTANGITPISAGDLILFVNNSNGGSAIQTVTSVDASNVYFDAGDWFGFNQRTGTAGTILNILNGAATVAAVRLQMVTYYVDAKTTPGTPRLTRVYNNGTPQQLAGVVEDLQLSYDLVDGVTNPVEQETIPTGYSPNQIRKVNVHVGVRSDTLAVPFNDYMRSHLSTVVTIRSLAFFNRYPVS